MENAPARQFRDPHGTEEDRRLATIESKLDEVLKIVNGLVRDGEVVKLRVTNLENAPAASKSSWTLGLNGCSTVLLAASAFAAMIGTLTGIAGIIIALVK